MFITRNSFLYIKSIFVLCTLCAGLLLLCFEKFLFNDRLFLVIQLGGPCLNTLLRPVLRRNVRRKELLRRLQ